MKFIRMKYRGKWNDYQWKNIKGIKRQKYDAGWVCKTGWYCDQYDQRMEEKKTNPTADKIMDICNVLQITPEQLLTGKGIEDEEEIVAASPESRFTPYDIQLIEDYHGLKEEQKKRLMAYVEALKKIESLENM